MTPSRGILLIVTVAFFAVMGVAQRARGVHLGRQVEMMKAERSSLEENNRQLLGEINALALPPRIAERAERLPVELVDPVELSRASLPHDVPLPTRMAPRSRH